MADLVYPVSLPGPTAAPYYPTERRHLSEIPGPRQSRPTQRDRLATQEVEFFFTREQLDVWTEWLEASLVSAGAWFTARWAQPQGGVGVRRFLGTPTYPTFYANVGWVVRATVEVRGEGSSTVSDGDVGGGDGDPTVAWSFVEGVGWEGSSTLAFGYTGEDDAVEDHDGVSYLNLTATTTYAHRDYVFDEPAPIGGGFELQYVVDLGADPVALTVGLDGIGLNFVALQAEHAGGLFQLRLLNLFGDIATKDITGSTGQHTVKLVLVQTGTSTCTVQADWDGVTWGSQTGLPWAASTTFEALVFYNLAASELEDVAGLEVNFRSVTFRAYAPLF